MSLGNSGFGIEPHSLTEIRRLCERTPGLERLWLFGSRARGDQLARSDIDLLADAPGWDAGQSLAFADALKQLPLVYPIDCAWWQDAGLQSTFREEVERDRKLLWSPRRHVAQLGAVGGIELKKFQGDALETLSAYLGELKRQADRSAQARQALLAMEDMASEAREVGDFPKRSWAALQRAGKLPSHYAAQPHSSRFDGADRPIPNVCLKVPTGGGKTLLAAAAVGHVSSAWLERHTGLVLWVVPNEAIYRQTFRALSERDHPYRQLLNVAGAGRVKILEKQSPLSRIDVDSHLCVMVLMLQSAARQSKETLRFFRDRGNVLGFLPPEDDVEAHWALLQQVPNLDVYGAFGGSAEEARRHKGSIVKSSLGNVMRLVRPIVVIDEGHHAYTDNALRTLDGFNPSFLLELSATPRVASPKSSGSNILVDVRGTDLDEAGMIKLPIRVDVREGHDWRGCLGAAVVQLDALQAEADALRAETGRYVRPILLVQVERTGIELRDAGFIHADSARAHLLQLGFSERQVAVKTSERNDLLQPENIDLLSPTCEVRAIITKQALQEGWDCPFAYVLCALAAGRSLGAMTQLVGRVLRLPDATRTGREALDACYVLCHDVRTSDVVRSVKSSLETEGMGDLAARVVTETGGRDDAAAVALRRRPQYGSLRLFLPRVTWAEPGRPRRELVYESDVLACLPWDRLDLAALGRDWAPRSDRSRTGRHFEIGLDVLERAVPRERAGADPTAGIQAEVDEVHIVRALLDIVPNAWQLWACVRSVIDRLVAEGCDRSGIAASADSLVERLRIDLETERERLAQLVFDEGVAAGRIEFRLRADSSDYELPREAKLAVAGPRQALSRDDGRPIEKSLLEPALRADMNELEAAFAGYLDEQAALRWWHRNVAKTQYGLQGWRRHRVYPDFVFGQILRDGTTRLVVMETKGLHLQGADTDYKRALLHRLTEAFNDARSAVAGKLDLRGTAESVVCDLVFSGAWKGQMEAQHFGDVWTAPAAP